MWQYRAYVMDSVIVGLLCIDFDLTDVLDLACRWRTRAAAAAADF